MDTSDRVTVFITVKITHGKKIITDTGANQILISLKS